MSQAIETDGPVREYVTVFIGGQLFGLAIERVHDVFLPQSMTRVPLAPPEIAGVLNLRGRIVTAIDMRRRLGLPPREPGARVIAVGIEWRGESFGLLIDSVGEVLRLAEADRQAKPANLDRKWAEVAEGVYRLERELMVILDVDRTLATGQDAAAA